MPETTEVLLDDFENTARWTPAGAGAARTHLTTFAEGAPDKQPVGYADGRRGADRRALVLLVRDAENDLDIELEARPDPAFAPSGEVSAVGVYVRSPHAEIRVSADLVTADGARCEVPLGRVPAAGDWCRIGHEPVQPLVGAEVRALRVRLVEVVPRAGEVMILLDDLTARTTR
ncbi:hypothetical protein [Nocardia harenae]|uniref:hypothetical protein n=1 Tax=Nocardia harenae TaxID=358707 RepID=UPI00083616B0|nr:hypothetical protein [Nocardia harenae]